MTILPFLALALSQPATIPPAPLDESQRRDLSCVAVLAIVASEQERGVESALAYPLLAEREGLSKTAQDLKTLAAVLDSRARDRLRAEGLSGQESDIILTQSREATLADARQREAQGQGSDLDYDHCFVLAAPDEKQPRNEH